MGSGGSFTVRRNLASFVAFTMAFVTFVFAAPQVARAATYQVNQNDTGCLAAGPVFCTINQALVVATAPGDVIQVAPGTYTESIGIFGQTLMIESTGGAAVTTIQATGIDALPVGVNTGTLTLVGFTITGANRTGGNVGGAIWVNGAAGTLDLRDSVVTGNSTASNGGGILNWGTTSITNSEISGNSATSGAGGVHNAGDMTITNSAISGNSGTIGAGVYTETNSLAVTHALTIEDSTIDANSASSTGGGLAARGGTTIVRRSTISGNGALGAGDGVWASVDLVEIENSTISGNSGPGAYATTTGQLNLVYSTVTNNQEAGVVSQLSTFPGTGVPGAVTLTRTIVAGNPNFDCSGGVALAAFNIIGSDNGCNLVGAGTGDVIGTTGDEVDPVLGPLADNGGPTLTHLPLSGSPAIDGANVLFTLPTDQRGIARPQGVTNDIGAVEVEALSLQQLIDVAAPGGIVLVPEGSYPESITIGDGKILQGSADPSLTNIDGDGTDGPTITATGDFTMSGFKVSGNTTGNGGALLVDSAGADFIVGVDNTTFSTANADALGGAIYVGSTDVVNVTDSLFTFNTAAAGGAIYADGALTVATSTFDGNSAGDGGAVLMTSAGSIADSTFTNNAATGNGGALYANMGTDALSVSGSTFHGQLRDG